MGEIKGGLKSWLLCQPLTPLDLADGLVCTRPALVLKTSRTNKSLNNARAGV